MNPAGDQLVELEIMGQLYRVKVSGSYEWAHKVGALVNKTMVRIQKETRLSDVAKVAILAALNLSDQLLLAEKNGVKATAMLADTSRQVVDVLEEALR